MLRKAMIVGAILFAVGLGACWLFGNMALRGVAAAVPVFSAPARDVSLTASDGVRLAATYWPGRRVDAPGVLLLHGLGASRGAMAQDARWLSGQGYAVLAIDFRGHGASQLEGRSIGLRESRDAAAAFAWLKQRQQGAKIGVIAVSLGGSAALIGDAGPLPADAMVLQLVYSDIRHAIGNRMSVVAGPVIGTLAEPLLSFQSLPRWGVWPSRLSPITAIRGYRGPVLVIGGETDRFTPPEESAALYAAAPNRHGLWIVPDLPHAQISALSHPEYARRVGALFADALGKP